MWLQIVRFIALGAAFHAGTESARARGVIATNHEEIFAWKRSAQLRDQIVALTKPGPIARDFDFRDQIRDSSASAPRNLSEGFYRFSPKEFAYFTFNLASWAMASTTNLLTYLLSCVALGKNWAPGSVPLPAQSAKSRLD